MHVVVVSTSYPSSPEDAAGHFVKAEVAVLLQAGHAVTVIAPAPQGAPTTRVNAGRPLPAPSDSGETVLWLSAGALFGAPGMMARIKGAPWRLAHLPAFTWKVTTVLRRLHYDRLVTHWLLPTAFPICFFAERGTRGSKQLDEIVVHGSDARLLSRFPESFARALLSGWVRRGVKIRCVSRELSDLLVAIYPPALKQIDVAPCAITLPTLLSKERLRQELGFGQCQYVLLCVGRLIENKRIDVALRCACAAGAQKIVVLGDGPLRRTLEQRFPTVEFKGQLSRFDALRHIKAADVLINASRLEGAPTVIREARALDTEVWTSAVGDVAAWAKSDRGIHIMPQLG